MVDDERGVALLDAGDVGERNLLAIGGGDEHLAERLRTDLEARRHFEHDAILVGLRVDGRDQPLAERIVERVVDGRDADAEAAGGIAIDVEEGLEAAVLQIAGHVGQLRATAAAARPASAPTRRDGSRPGSSSVNWNCVRLTRSSIVRSCTGCM